MFRSTTLTVLTALLAVSALPAHAAPTWVREYVGLGNCSDRIGGMALDSKGNLYLAGHTPYPGNHEFFLLKYDPRGNHPWGVPWYYDTGADDYAYDLVIDGNDDIYVCGATARNFTNDALLLMKIDKDGIIYWFKGFRGWNVGGPGEKSIAIDQAGDIYIAGALEMGTDDSDFMTTKYDSTGHRQWTSLHNGPADESDYPIAMVSDDRGNVYVTGPTDANQARHNDIATMKYAPDGTRDWLAVYDGPENGNDSDEVRDIAIDAKCNVYITGSTDTQNDTLDAVTIKYNGAGQEVWVARYNGPFNSNDYGNALEVDAEGNVYVALTSRFDAVTWEIVIIKYSPAGSELWVRRHRGPGEHNTPEDIALDGMGNIYVAAVVDDTIDWDVFTLKYSPDGALLWQDRYHSGPGNADRPEQMLVDWDGDIYLIATRDKAANPFSDCASMILKYQQSGLVSHWKLDEETGTVAPDSAGTHDATVVFQGPIGLWHWGRGPQGWDGALQLDGSNYAVVPNHADYDITDQLTVAAWVKVNAFDSPWASFVSKGEYSWRLQRDGTNNIVEFSTGYWQTHGGVFGATAINDGAWHHLVGTTDGAWEYLYVDGRLDGSHQRNAATPTAVQLSTEPIMIGSNPHFTDRTHVGLIDDVRIYKRALSDDEVTALYHKHDPKDTPACTFLPQDYNKDGLINFLDLAYFAQVWLERTIP